jgi:hypothetical protein
VSGGANSGSAKGTFPEIDHPLSIVFASLSFVYAIGLLIVNLNLRAKGLSEVDLARPGYLLVGGLWTFLVVTPLSFYYLPSWCRAERRQMNEEIREGAHFVSWLLIKIWRVWRFSFYVVGYFFIVIYIALYITGWKLGCIGYSEYFFALFLGVLSAGSLVRVFSAAIDHTRTFPETNGKFRPLAFEALGAMALLVFALIFYSVWAYPHIMRGYGGGYELKVELALSDPSPSSVPWNCADIQISPDGKLVGPALLVLENSSYLFLETDPDSLVESKNKAEKTSVPCPETTEQQKTISIKRESVATVLIVGNSRIGLGYQLIQRLCRHF